MREPWKFVGLLTILFLSIQIVAYDTIEEVYDGLQYGVGEGVIIIAISVIVGILFCCARACMKNYE